ncbi:MAG: adenosylhomocysteinase [Oscillospiraceae bacterium]|nr:adenosylhomocysteinase [Oscillospiraceae bacterium]
MSIIRDASLAGEGLKKIEWVKDFMPVLSGLERRFAKEKPFAGMKVAVSVHMEAKTAYLCLVLRAAGAQVAATGSNVLSTKDEICAALDSLGIDVYAWHNATKEEYFEHLKKTLEFKPDLIIDDGGDFVALLHEDCRDYGSAVIGGCEETTTGIHRLRARAAEGSLLFPMMAVNDADCKHLFDNHHGTGQSTWDGIMFTTNNLVAGKVVVVAGYGFCGSGIAKRAKGLGARVIVCETSPIRALEAAMEGFEVLKMDDAARLGDYFVTVTGCRDVITKRHFEVMKNNAIVANSGHFDVEFSKPDLLAMSERVETRKPFIEGYYLKDGRVINVMAEGRLVNIAAGNGHPAEIMDLSFAMQLLSARYIAENGRNMAPGVYDVPFELDDMVARMKVEAMGLGLDEFTEAQTAYLNGTGAE